MPETSPAERAQRARPVMFLGRKHIDRVVNERPNKAPFYTEIFFKKKNFQKFFFEFFFNFLRELEKFPEKNIFPGIGI